MSWYRNGTVTVQNGSATVIGAGTAWNAGAKVSEGFKGPDGQLYEILSINADTQLTLGSPYLGANAAGQSYVIVPTQAYLRDLDRDVQELITEFGGVVDGVGKGLFPAGTALAPSVRGLADQDTGLNLPGNNVVQLVTAGQARLTVDGAGGVATSSTVSVGAGVGYAGPASSLIAGGSASDFGLSSNGNIQLSAGTGKKVNVPGAFSAGQTNINGLLYVSSGQSAWFNFLADVVGASVGTFYKGGTTTPIGYLGSDGGGIVGSGTGNSLGIRSENDLLLMSQSGAVRPGDAGGTQCGTVANPWSTVQGLVLRAQSKMKVGPIYSSAPYNFINNTDGGEGSPIMEVLNSNTGSGIAVFSAATSGFGSGAACVLGVAKNSTTNRGIATSGTINASGADYAEYHYTVSYAIGRVVKGQIIGLTANDEVTDKWSDAVSGFAIKSTDPSLVGGDTWASKLVPPTEPPFEEPEFQPDPPAPFPPFVPPSMPALPPEPAAPAQDAGSAERGIYEGAMVRRMEAVRLHQAAVAEAANAYSAAQREAADAHFASEREAYATRVAQSRAAYERGPFAAYQQAKAKFDAELEAARQTVDRVAYAGRVPVNVLGAKPGDYIVAAEGPNDTIVGNVVTAADMRADMARYLLVVGRVRAILPDGRASCAVVIH